MVRFDGKSKTNYGGVWMESLKNSTMNVWTQVWLQVSGEIATEVQSQIRFNIGNPIMVQVCIVGAEIKVTLQDHIWTCRYEKR